MLASQVNTPSFGSGLSGFKTRLETSLSSDSRVVQYGLKLLAWMLQLPELQSIREGLEKAQKDLSSGKVDSLVKALGATRDPLLALLPQGVGQKIFSLACENSRGSFGQGVLELAGCFEDKQKLQAAGQLLSLAKEALAGVSGFESSYQQVLRRLEVLNGGGGITDQVQMFARSLPHELKNGSMLMGMMAAGLANPLGARLVGKLLGSSLGQGTRLLASNFGGLLADGFAFESASRGVRILQGQEVGSFGEGLTHAYWMIGNLRVMGLVGKTFSQSRNFSRAITSLARNQAHQVHRGMHMAFEYGGIYLSQTQGHWVGLEQSQVPYAWMQSLFTLGHFKVAGASLGGLAPGFMALTQRLQRETAQALLNAGHGLAQKLKNSLLLRPPKSPILNNLAFGLGTHKSFSTSQASFTEAKAALSLSAQSSESGEKASLVGRAALQTSPKREKRAKTSTGGSAQRAAAKARERKGRKKRSAEEIREKALNAFNRKYPIPKGLPAGDKAVLEFARKSFFDRYGDRYEGREDSYKVRLGSAVHRTGLNSGILQNYLERGVWSEFEDHEINFLQRLIPLFPEPTADHADGEACLVANGLLYPRPSTLKDFSKISQEALEYWYYAFDRRYVVPPKLRGRRSGEVSVYSGPRLIQFRLGNRQDNLGKVLNFRLTSGANRQVGSDWLTLRLDRVNKEVAARKSSRQTIEGRYYLVMLTPHSDLSANLSRSPAALEGDLTIYSKSGLVELFKHPNLIHREDLDAFFAHQSPKDDRLILRLREAFRNRPREISLVTTPVGQWQYDGSTEVMIRKEGKGYRLSSFLGEEAGHYAHELRFYSPASLEGVLQIGSDIEPADNSSFYLADLASLDKNNEMLLRWYEQAHPDPAAKGPLVLRYQFLEGDRLENVRLSTHFDTPRLENEGEIHLLKVSQGKKAPTSQFVLNAVLGAGASRVGAAIVISPAVDHETQKGPKLVLFRHRWDDPNALIHADEIYDWTDELLEGLYQRAYPERKSILTWEKRGVEEPWYKNPDAHFFVRFTPELSQPGYFHYEVGRLSDYQELPNTQVLFIAETKPFHFHLRGAYGAGVEDKIAAARESEASEKSSLLIAPEDSVIFRFDPFSL